MNFKPAKKLLDSNNVPDDMLVEVLNKNKAFYNRCVGYCYLHKGFVTNTQIIKRNCLNKQCKYFYPKEV